MKNASEKRGDPTFKFITRVYLIFWAAIAAVGVLAYATNQNVWAFQLGSAVASWVPTMVLLVMFPRLFPGRKRKEWLTSEFSAKINLPLVLVVLFTYLAATCGAFAIVAARNQIPYDRLASSLTPSFVLMTLFFSLIQGATGEELCWRGYLQPYFEKKNHGNVLKSALQVGLIWSFWHTPLWFVTGLQPDKLLVYIVTFIIGNLSLAIIIAVSHHRCKNMAIPMWVHFVSNAVGTLLAAGIDQATEIDQALELRCWGVLFYTAAAIAFSLWHILSRRKIAGAAH